MENDSSMDENLSNSVPSDLFDASGATSHKKPKKTYASKSRPANLDEIPAQKVMEFFEKGIPITDTDLHVVLRKANDVIKVKGNTLGLLPRKVIDACFYIARQSNESTGTTTSGMYSVSYDYFAWLIDFDSKNTGHLKKRIGEILESPIEINIVDLKNPEKDFWLKTNFLYDVCITNGRVFFGIPESIRQSILNPRSFTNLSLRIQNSFSSLYAYILYARCRAELFRGVTEWWEMNEFRRLMNVAGMYPQLQDFHKRVIYLAMDQINGLPGKYEGTDISITPDYMLSGRTKTHIRFFVEANPEFSGIKDKEKLPRDIYEILKSEFGLSNSQVNEVATHPIDYVKEKIEFARHRIQHSKTKIGKPDSYFMNVIREDLRLNKIELDAVEKASKQRSVQIGDLPDQKGKAIDTRPKDASLTAYKSLTEDGRLELLDQFKLSSEYKSIKTLDNGNLNINSVLENTLIRFAFTGWLTSNSEQG